MSRRLQTDARRAQLLELGVQLFTQHAYEDVSIERVAQRAGISKGLLYHYFGGKRSFYVACMAAAAEDLVQTVIVTDDTLPRPTRLRRGLTAYFDWVEARADAYLALMRGGVGRDPELTALVDRTRERILARLWEQVGLEDVTPSFRFASRAWLGAVEAAAEEWLAVPDLSRDQLVEMLAANLGVNLAVAYYQCPEADIALDLPGPLQRLLKRALSAGTL